MPIYEYHCDSCDKNTELLQDIDEEPVKSCPQCKSENFRKVISVSSFRLKGTGWYETDFKNSNNNKKNK
jgi:putative FmdB family regulatory protein